MQSKNYLVLLLLVFVSFSNWAQERPTFTLINAETDIDILQMQDGQEIDFEDIEGFGVNIRVDIAIEEVRSVRLTLTNEDTFTEQIEGKAPYALYGDINGNYKSRNMVPGNYTLTAQFYNMGGARGELLDSSTIVFSIVERINEPPISVIATSEVSGTAPLEILFSAASSSDDLGIESYEWDFGDGTGSSLQNAAKTYDNAGEYTVTLKVTDAEGLSDTANVFITVFPALEPPVASIGADVTEGTAPLTVNFINTATNDDDEGIGYLWDFGDGATSTLENPQHTFETPGTFVTTLMVEGSNGLTAQDRIPITVHQPEVFNFDIAGELKKWHRITVSFNGPEVSESDEQNPFLWYRHTVTFTAPSGKVFSVPGFFAADGNAAETSSDSGNKWQVRFTPNEIGQWSFTTSFRMGENIAVDTDLEAGTPIFFDGTEGSFTIAPSDKIERDNRAKGRLNYVNQRYLQFEETKAYFLKAGSDSPENFLAFEDFDNTIASKNWEPHLQDWQEGDPTWQDGKGRGILGAVNYLASKGMNAFSFLTMNVRGDGKDVWPWRGDNNDLFVTQSEESREQRKRYDVSKLEQWELLFEHGDNNGMFLHFKLQEVENDRLLDEGNLGIERKLYLREFIARFGHHLALNWNLGEENRQTDQQRKDMASYIAQTDPYDHHIVIHTAPTEQDQIYVPLLGDESRLTGASVQAGLGRVHEDVQRWVEQSAATGRPWAVANDEQGGAKRGVSADEDYPGDTGIQLDNRTDVLRQALWGTLMAGGYGVEYYFGYETGETDLSAQDFRSRETKWEDAKIAMDFFQEKLPFIEMVSMDGLITGERNFCFAKPNEIYLLYLDNGRDAVLDLSAANGTYSVQYFDPLTGFEIAQETGTRIASGNQTNTLSTGIDENREDVIALVQIDQRTPVAIAGSNITEGEAPLLVKFDASASIDDNEIISYQWDFDNGNSSTEISPEVLFEDVGIYDVILTVTDNDGLQGTDRVVITVRDRVPEFFTFINSATNEEVIAIRDEMEIGVEQVTNLDLNIRYNPNGKEQGSVVMELQGPVNFKNTESTAPYALFGDIGGSYKSSNTTFTQGNYVLIAQRFSLRGGRGELLETITTNFTILEEEINEGPNAILGADSTNGFAPLTVNFNATGSTDDKGITSYFWDFGDGGSSIESAPAYTFNIPGLYDVQLIVRDEEGLEATDTILIEVIENLPPIAEIDASSLEVVAPFEVDFDASASLDDFGIVSYEWAIDGEVFDTQLQTTYLFENPGEFEISLVVTDAGGLTDIRALQITALENQAPTAVLDSTPVNEQEPLMFQFTGEASFDDVAIVSYLWNFGDGSVSEEVNPRHTYQTSGTYTVILAVTDVQGLEGIATTTLAIEEIAQEEEEILLLATDQFDPDDTVASQKMDFYIGQNVAKGVALLQFNQNPQLGTQIQIYSMEGQMVKESTVKSNMDSPTYAMDINNLPNGYYPMVVQTPTGDRMQQMLVVQN